MENYVTDKRNKLDLTVSMKKFWKHYWNGILQARILEWVAFPFSRGSFQPGDWTQVSHSAGIFFTNWAPKIM